MQSKQMKEINLKSTGDEREQTLRAQIMDETLFKSLHYIIKRFYSNQNPSSSDIQIQILPSNNKKAKKKEFQHSKVIKQFTTLLNVL